MQFHESKTTTEKNRCIHRLEKGVLDSLQLMIYVEATSALTQEKLNRLPFSKKNRNSWAFLSFLWNHFHTPDARLYRPQSPQCSRRTQK